MRDKKTADSKAGRKANNSADNSTTAAANHSDKTVFEIQKNARERIKISVGEYKGKQRIDVRVWYVDAGGEYQPSRNGISLRPDQATPIMQGIALAARAIDPQGMH